MNTLHAMPHCRAPRRFRLSLAALALAFSAYASGAEQAPREAAVPEPSTLLTPGEAYANPASPSLTILVAATGRRWVEKRYLEQGALRQNSVQIDDLQPNALAKALVSLCGDARDLQIYILLDRNARFQSYVDVLKVLRQLHFTRIAILATDASRKAQ